ncbi:MAG: heavy metal efflux pump cobalt-zinc-cadmium [Puniceicoccaceae bacterium 5H]|nr:MAG: heavy metal efflux pump cobalt-zinc-cadmium [Puniceicoccaceae bacterium 5H]
MLNAIVAAALRFKGIVLIVAALVMGYGIFLAQQTTLDVFPEFVPPQVTIQTEAPGLSPEEVESLVTFPIEAAVGGIAGLETTRSESIQGLSVVDVIFKDGTDLLTDRQLLSERLTEVVNSLPTQAKAPSMSPMVSSTMDLLKIGLVSEGSSPIEMRSVADWTLVPLLKAVPGVAEVTVVGGEAAEIQITPDPDRLAAFGVSYRELTAAAANATGIRGTGYLETHNQRLVLHATVPTATPETIAATPLRGEAGNLVRLGDVATVSLGAMPKFGDALINGQPGVMLAMTSQYGANTLTTTRAVEAALDEVRPMLQSKGITLIGSLHRPANFIEIALAHLTESLMLGGALVAAVLLLFLFDLRTAFISFISIPLSLLAAVIVMHLSGIPLNTMTLGGLAVAVGVVVDDAIIDVENILRRLRENAQSTHPRPRVPVILEASLEVRGSVIYATLVVMAVFIPVFALSGIQGRFFGPLGVSFILAILASLLTAMTVVPALSLLLLRKAGRQRELFYVRWLKTGQEALLRIICRVPIVAGTVSLLLVVCTGWLLQQVPSELMPLFREGHFVLQAFGVPGTSLGETMRFGESVSERLLALPEVKSVEMQAGRSEKGVDTWGPERCEFHVELDPDVTMDEGAVQERIRAIMESYPNVQTETLTFLGDRMSESLSGETAAVVISIFGQDLQALNQAAAQVRGVVQAVPGAIEVQSLGEGRAPSLEVELDEARLQTYGLQAVTVLETLQTAYQGTEVTQVYRGNQIIPVTVRLPDEARTQTGAVSELLIPTSTGALVPLGDLGRVYLTDRPASLSHQDGRRRQVVTCNVEGRDVASFVAEAQQAVAERVNLPEGAYTIWGGAAEAEATAHRELLASTGVTLVLIGIFLAIVFRKARHLLLVLANLPFAVAGGIVAIYVSGLPLSLGALVGFITLLGLSTRNAIMLMTHYEHLVTQEGVPWGLEAVLRGARERVVPVIMTAAVAGLAILPLALQPTSAGREIEGPMAVVILGGLVSSTLVTLFILPALAHRFARFEPGRGA